jgi:hypothetical protein
MSGEEHRQRGFAHRHDVNRGRRLNRASDGRLVQRTAHERTRIDRLQRRADNGCQVATKLGKCFQ